VAGSCGIWQRAATLATMRAQTALSPNPRRAVLVTPPPVITNSSSSHNDHTVAGRAPVRTRKFVRSTLRPSFVLSSRTVCQAQTGRRSSAVARTKLHLLVEQRRRQELRFYRSRPRLRLPATAVTRQRRRRGGLGLFSRNTLKRPQTLAGLKTLLLPPREAPSAIFVRAQLGGFLDNATVHTPEQQHSEDAQVWIRPPSRNNRKLQFFIRRARLPRVYRLAQQQAKHAAINGHRTPSLRRNMLAQVDSTLTLLSGAKQASTPAHRKAILQSYQQYQSRKALSAPEAAPGMARLRKVQQSRFLRFREGVLQKRRSSL
jgi:hypothetical protein